MIKMYNVMSRKTSRSQTQRLGLETVSRPIFQRSRSREILVGLGLGLETKCLGLVSVSKPKVSFTSLCFALLKFVSTNEIRLCVF